MIKRVFLLLLLIFTGSVLGFAQKNFRAIDKRAIETPASAMRSIPQLADYLTATARDDYEKARAIYTWITQHITYSDTTLTNGWLGTPENSVLQQAENVLKNRTGVCEGFANLYKSLCVAAGLQAEVVTGSVKEEDGTVADVGHAWNAVQLQGQWFLTDPTWGSGYADYWRRRFIREHREAYFVIPAGDLIQSHLPDDPIWQLLPNPLTEQEFYHLSLIALSARLKQFSEQPFVYQDSIAQWFRQDSTQRMLSASERILQFNPDNSLALARLGNHFYNQALITFFYAEEQILNALDTVQYKLDTATILTKLAVAEKQLTKGWQYYSQVKDAELKTTIAEIPPSRAILADFDYLRGLMCVWQVTQLTRELENAPKDLSNSYFDYLHQEAQRGQHYLTLAKTAYHDFKGSLYEDAAVKVKLHEALLYNYLAKADAFVSNLSETSTEADLQAAFDRLDRAEVNYAKMNGLVKEVIREDSASILALSFTEEYPMMMAAFQTDRGYIYQFLLQKKYAAQWEQSAQWSKKSMDEMLLAYRKFGDYADEGLGHLKTVEKSETTQEINDKLRILKGNMYAYQGDIQARYLITELNKITKESEFKPRQKAFLNSCDEILKCYRIALEWMESNAKASAYLIESTESVKEMRKRIAGY